MSDRIPVRMLKHSHGLNPGEIAGFVPEVAERLIAAGAAAPLDGAEAAQTGAGGDGEKSADPAPATDTKSARKAAAAAALPEGGAEG